MEKQVVSPIGIIPAPKKVSWTGEKAHIAPAIECSVPQWQTLTVVVQESVRKVYSITMEEGPGGISILYDETIAPQAYRLCVTDKAVLCASDYQGACYGAASLLQLMDRDGFVAQAEVEDWPEKDYRGLMINTVKYWQPFGSLLNYVDMCFWLKIRYFHLHLTDIQNYTLPSRHFPKLTEAGNSYTEEELKILRSYAMARGVELIPELDMPGHMTIFNRVYPEIFSDSLMSDEYEKAETENGQQLNDQSIICAGNPKTFEAVLTLIDEVLELFPESRYIHLGSDEANYHVWDQCRHCRQYIREHQLADSKELYAEFVGRVTNYVLQKGRVPIIWEGFSEEHAPYISKDVIVVGWENYYQLADRLLEHGYQVINCAWKPLYIVEYEGRRFHYPDVLDWHVHEWQHWWPKSPAYYEPIRVAPTEQVLGAQICVWSIPYEEGVAWTAENLAALSERTWTVENSCSLEAFEQKLPRCMETLQMLMDHLR